MHLSAQVPQYRIDEPCWSIRLEGGFAGHIWGLLVHLDFTVWARRYWRRHRILVYQGSFDRGTVVEDFHATARGIYFANQG
jgi:hypothetical protein